MTEPAPPDSESRAPDKRLWDHAAGRDALLLIGLALLAWIVAALWAITAPLLVAFLLAYVFDPVFRFLKNKARLPRGASAVVVLVLVLAGLTWAGAALGPLLVEQTGEFIKNTPEYLRHLKLHYGVDLSRYASQSEVVQKVKENPMQLLSFLGQYLGEGFGTITAIFFWVFLLPVFFIFFGWKYPDIKAGVRRAWPTSSRESMLHTAGRMNQVLAAFFRGRLLVALLTGVLFSLGWWVANVPYWFFLGLATGLMGIVPYLSAVGYLAALGVKFFDMTLGPDAPGFDFVAVLVWPSAVFYAFNFLEEWVFMPYIQSKALDLSVPAVIVAVLVGAYVGGILGLLLAIPVAACLKILMEELAAPYLGLEIGRNRDT
jgi:predicted PurR-regulated permease PerM